MVKWNGQVLTKACDVVHELFKLNNFEEVNLFCLAVIEADKYSKSLDEVISDLLLCIRCFSCNEQQNERIPQLLEWINMVKNSISEDPFYSEKLRFVYWNAGLEMTGDRREYTDRLCFYSTERAAWINREAKLTDRPDLYSKKGFPRIFTQAEVEDRAFELGFSAIIIRDENMKIVEQWEIPHKKLSISKIRDITAEIMGWSIDETRHGSYHEYYVSKNDEYVMNCEKWNPDIDHNQTQLLIEQAVSHGLEQKMVDILRSCSFQVSCAVPYEDPCTALMRLSAYDKCVLVIRAFAK